MVYLKDVAKKAGVSEGTVSMVLNGKPGPKEETRSLVLKTVQELNYLPNSNARNLARKESTTVGLVVTDIENPFFGSITRYVNQYLEEHHFSMVLSLSNDETATEDNVIRNFIQQGVRAIILAPTQIARKQLQVLRDLQARKIPFVFISSYYENIDAPRVLTDYRQGSYDLVRYLLDTGHKDIRYLVSSDIEAPIAQERIRGFMDAYDSFALSPHADSIYQCPRPDYESGYREAGHIMRSARPDAIIAINDFMALGAKHAVLNLGFSVPRDLSIAGYDDVVYASMAEIPLTTVRQNIPEIARSTVDLLLRESFRTSIDIRVAPELMIRRSTESRF